MVLNIKDADTDRLAREVASRTGESITVAIRVALEQRASRLQRVERRRGAREEMLDLIRAGRDARHLDTRSDEEILGYDAHGLPS